MRPAFGKPSPTVGQSTGLGTRPDNPLPPEASPLQTVFLNSHHIGWLLQPAQIVDFTISA
ncbi:MAG: hypothetical protein CMJ62_06025 [Planctomycetaceae bacterium]|nr:hypothetical protein [Planctomycetaceae bacterium]